MNIPLIHQVKRIKGKKTVSNNKKDRREILFSNIPQKTTDCRNACNIISNKHGVTLEFRQTETERDPLQLFLTKAMIENIVNYTNKRINETLENVGQEVIQTGKYLTDIYGCYRYLCSDWFGVYAWSVWAK